jgi:hypothetical protein
MSDPALELVVNTSSYGTPPLSKNNNEWLLLLQPVAYGTATAADANGHQQEHMLLAKRMIHVSHSSSTTSVSPARHGGSKQPKMMETRADLCCFCLVATSCSLCNCPCAKAGRPCHSCNLGKCSCCTNMVEALNRVVCLENTCHLSSIAARFQQRVGWPLEVLLPLHEVPLPLADDKDKGKLVGSKNNKLPGNAELLVNDHANGRAPLMVFLPFVRIDKEDNDNNGALTNAFGITANGSNATMASTTALNRLVNGSNAPLALPAALGLPANGSNLSEEGDATDAGSFGKKETPIGDGIMGDSSIPLMQQSTFYPIFQ